MSAPTVVRPAGQVELARALAAWRQVESGIWSRARDYADAVEAESDALSAYAQTVAAGAPEEEVAAARAVLAGTLSAKEDAARRLGVTERPEAVARAGQDLIGAARAARGDAVAP